MRILIVLIQPFDSSTGGVQMSTQKLSNYFSSVGADVSVYSFSNTGHVAQNTVKVFSSPEPNRHYNDVNLKHLHKVVEEIRPDVVINQMPYEHAITSVLKESHARIGYLLLGCLRNTLFSVKLNLDSYLEMVVPRPARPLLRNPIGYAALLAMHKRSHANDLKKILDAYDFFVMFGPPNKDEIEYFIRDYKADKLAYIPNSIPSVLSAVPPKEKRILWLSRLSYKQKRAEFILPVWKIVSKALPDWELDIVGDGDAYEDVKRQVASENIPRVTIHGRQKADPFFLRAPIYFMTSSFEGFPNTVIEAQSFASIPVVFNSYPMLDWIVKDGENGVLIKPFQIEKMAEAIIKIAQDEGTRNHMMQRAVENAQRFVINKVGQQWMQFFESQGKTLIDKA
jgi:glycosyltransferase involved in cell wall biosynthesis